MKKLVSLIVLMLMLMSVSAVFASDVWVNGYQKSDGTYVEGHHRSSPDQRQDNNYNYGKGNNPYK